MREVSCFWIVWLDFLRGRGRPGIEALMGPDAHARSECDLQEIEAPDDRSGTAPLDWVATSASFATDAFTYELRELALVLLRKMPKLYQYKVQGGRGLRRRHLAPHRICPGTPRAVARPICARANAPSTRSTVLRSSR